MQTNTNNH